MSTQAEIKAKLIAHYGSEEKAQKLQELFARSENLNLSEKSKPKKIIDQRVVETTLAKDK